MLISFEFCNCGKCVVFLFKGGRVNGQLLMNASKVKLHREWYNKSTFYKAESSHISWRNHRALLVSKQLIFCHFAFSDTDTGPRQKKRPQKQNQKACHENDDWFCCTIRLIKSSPTELGLCVLSLLSFAGPGVEICTDECWVGSLKCGTLRQASWIELAYSQLIRDM